MKLTTSLEEKCIPLNEMETRCLDFKSIQKNNAHFFLTMKENFPLSIPYAITVNSKYHYAFSL